MKAIILFAKSPIRRPSLRPGFLLIPLMLNCLGLAPMARAVGPDTEGAITVGSVVAGDRVVGERISASGTIEKPGGVAKERINASGGVEATIGIAKQGSKTRRRILVAGSELVKRLEASASVPDPTGAADQHPSTFAIVGARYGTVRVGTHRLRHRCKPKTGKQERDEKWWTCCFELNR